MFVALLGLALAAPGDPPSEGIVAGRDIGAWVELLASRPEGDAEVAALEGFLVAWPESSLAEVAYARLVDLGALDGVVERHPDLAPWLPLLERSRAEHVAELARTRVATTVIPLDADGEPRTRPSRRRVSPRPDGT